VTGFIGLCEMNECIGNAMYRARQFFQNGVKQFHYINTITNDF